MKEELWEDVIKELDSELDKCNTVEEMNKVNKKFAKRIEKSIGWIEFETIERQQVHKGKLVKGTPIVEEIDHCVNMGDGSMISTPDEMEARVLGILAQLDYRLRRMEKKLNEMQISRQKV